MFKKPDWLVEVFDSIYIHKFCSSSSALFMSKLKHNVRNVLAVMVNWQITQKWDIFSHINHTISMMLKHANKKT